LRTVLRFVPQAARGFISDGSTMMRAGACLVFSGDKGVLMSLKPDIDPKTGKIDAPVELGGAPEFLASDGAGKVYMNLMDKNEVAVFDIKARKVVSRRPGCRRNEVRQWTGLRELPRRHPGCCRRDVPGKVRDRADSENARGRPDDGP
jgi:hypothetical protein